MRFDKLRLTGFKSFVEPTEFIIETGLTGVVGPNGCGKSNLVEALRWVMGESSYKNMRASGMDDVIFSGSATRPSRNTAEVSLFLDNSTRTAPAAFNDADLLQVTRRIEREAGSAYKINGRDARARDVQLLFADQSTGARSPSMVGQGRIGELIQAKPQARRALLEEAAGISGLHSRRHEAELRLRAAEANLERLDDVVSELETQIDSLRRQARQANRFRTLSRDIRQAEATLLHLKWLQAKTAEADAQSALSTATGSVAEHAKAQMEAARLQAIARQKLPGLRDAEAEAAAALQRLTIARDRLDEEAARIAARKREYTQRLDQLAEDIAREQRMIDDNAGMLEALDAERVQIEQAEAGSGAREAELAEAIEGARVRLEHSEAELARATEARAETAALRTQLERRIADAEQKLARLARERAATAAERDALAEKIAGLPDPADRQAAAEAADRAIVHAEQQALAAERAVTAARAAETELRPELATAREALNALEAEAKTIARLVNATSDGLFAGVIETLKVDRGYETALGAALGDDLDVPVDASAPAHWSRVDPAQDDPGLPAGCEPLAARVRGAPELARRLAQIGIVASEDEGARLQAALRPGQRLVTLQGATWRWDGYVAAADAPTPAAQRLAQKNRLSELDGEIAAARQVRQGVEARIAQAESATRAAVDAESAARTALRDRQEAARKAREELAAAERAAGDLGQRRAVLEQTVERQAEDVRETEAVLAEARTALAAEPDVGGLDNEIARHQAVVAADRAALAEARAEHAGVARERQDRARRLAAIERERTGWIRRRDSGAAQVETLASRQAETTKALEAIVETPEDFAHKRRLLDRQIEDADTARKAAADALAAAEGEAGEADKAAAEALTALSQAREGRARAEERLSAAAERRGDCETRIREALNCAPHEAFAATGLAVNDELPGIDPLEKRLERLKVERERLGAVNLRAEEEQTELVARRNELTGERDDVIAAIAELRAAIASLNKEGRDRLVAAFDLVQDHFKRLFTHLFGGGTAELQLVESDDPLEAGLEILARPPGKKPQTMTLLSGGEQALTALALIFAVFLTNPAPICVLDEVDAPLDDHNVERFCDLMDEMARQTETRFVLITHNPITMARMNRLFGVTMAEQGISQLVSVDLNAAEELREAS
ncbi:MULTISPECIES: chromosome segregation protein SMC [unclassified Roseitalea]|uniref:chromosome segregation protein SMC n=1 Tax=unclassified Roseitalea TaxID=2639107 RepID=UPI00273F6527|nr:MULTISPECIES: chromosome segregation protein SMC [unclassified Roseitalea]